MWTILWALSWITTLLCYHSAAQQWTQTSSLFLLFSLLRSLTKGVQCGRSCSPPLQRDWRSGTRGCWACSHVRVRDPGPAGWALKPVAGNAASTLQFLWKLLRLRRAVANIGTTAAPSVGPGDGSVIAASPYENTHLDDFLWPSLFFPVKPAKMVALSVYQNKAQLKNGRLWMLGLNVSPKSPLSCWNWPSFELWRSSIIHTSIKCRTNCFSS